MIAGSPGLPRPWQFIDIEEAKIGKPWIENYAVDGLGGPSRWMPLPEYLNTPAQPTHHPETGEPYGTDAQEATAWRLKAENLERENAGVAAGSRWKINTPS